MKANGILAAVRPPVDTPAPGRSRAGPARLPGPAVAAGASGGVGGATGPQAIERMAEAARRRRREIQEQALATHDVRLAYHDEADRVVVEVRDRETGELLRQLPPEELVQLSRQLRELLGSLIDERS